MNSSTAGIVAQVDGVLKAAAPIASLGDDTLRSRVVECEEAMRRLQAAQAEAMVEMGVRARVADRAEADHVGQPSWSRECREEFVADEIAVLLGCTRITAGALYDRACRAVEMPVVHGAWRAGRLDGRKAGLICEQVAHLNPATALGVASDAVEYATQSETPRTVPQLREWLRRRVIAADPGAAEARRQRALADRRVVVTPGDDGMSELWALLPAVQARQIQLALTETAQEVGSDDTRTMDQRRADTLVDLLLGRGDPPAVDVHVVVPADTLAGASQEPGWVPGLGPVTADEARDVAGTGESTVTWRRLITDPVSGALTDVAEKRYRPSAALERAVRARDVTCRFPGCRRSADSAGTDLDHTVPWPVGPTSAANLAVLCRRHHRLKHTAGWSVLLDATGAMTWTTPTGRQYRTEPWQYTDPDPPRSASPTVAIPPGADPPVP
jgi:hypothetical protein